MWFLLLFSPICVALLRLVPSPLLLSTYAIQHSKATMKRPADQAKLLLFYLLQNSAAAIRQDHICVRLARRTDISSIQRCNLATLPENYNSQFYLQHLRTWPDLCVVAEHVSPRIPTFGRPDPKIVAYVLGKVDETTVGESPFFSHHSHLSPQDRDDFYESHYLSEQQQTTTTTTTLGHVTSLAVLEEYRRQGLAAALMEQLHYHLETRHGCTEVGLHVRTSNRAAARLYQRDGYEVESVIPHYYQDGEDAYFMRKNLLEQEYSRERHRELELPRQLSRCQKESANSGEPSISITGTL
jgi:ribosomal protein S18 acetylase RimI-like enzyme